MFIGMVLLLSCVGLISMGARQEQADETGMTKE